jgi:hypothetical protein
MHLETDDRQHVAACHRSFVCLTLARPPMGGLAFLLFFTLSPHYQNGTSDIARSWPMKLSLFFVLMDTLILIAYPIVYVTSKLRRLTKFKR